MQIKSYPLGQLQANCYLLTKDKECLIIDPADDANFLLEEISRLNLHLVGMLGTHGHFDHLMAVGEIQLSIKAPLYIHNKDLFLVKRLKETAKHFLGFEPHIISPTIIEFVPTGILKIKNFKLKIIPTPGHTPGSCCLYFRDEQTLFTGDTLFKEAIGRTDLSYSSKVDLETSLKTLFALPMETIVYPGHGESTLIGQEEALYHF